MSKFSVLSLLFVVILTVYSMPLDQEVIGGKVPHPNSAAGQALSGGMTGGKSVPHPNSAAGQALSAGATGGSSVPHPNSAAGQALSAGATGGSSVPHPNSAAGQALSEKSVLEGGTQVKPWLKNQPDLANLSKQQ